MPLLGTEPRVAQHIISDFNDRNTAYVTIFLILFCNLMTFNSTRRFLYRVKLDITTVLTGKWVTIRKEETFGTLKTTASVFAWK
jgi:hypothetical protein